MFPSGFLATDSRLLKDVWDFCFAFFLLPSKKLNKNKVISININCSNCLSLSCSPYWKMIKSQLFFGGHDKGYYGIMIGICHSNGTTSHSSSDSRTLSTNEFDLLFISWLIQSSFSITSLDLFMCDQFLRREVYFLLLSSNSVILYLVSFLTNSLKCLLASSF